MLEKYYYTILWNLEQTQKGYKVFGFHVDSGYFSLAGVGLFLGDMNIVHTLV